MKAVGTTYWNFPNTNATNESGFTALAAGFRNETDGAFYGLGKYAYWWSSDTSKALHIFYTDSSAINGPYSKVSGNGVRCVRDY